MGDKHIKPLFGVWCQKILPLVYDDSLSYYEQICKLYYAINMIIDNQNAINANIEKYCKEILDGYLADGKLSISTSYDPETGTLTFNFTNLGG